MQSESVQDLRLKLAELKVRLMEFQPGIIAVSGGIDSRLLSSLCWKWKLNYWTVFFKTPLLSPGQIKHAREFLQKLGLDSKILKINPLLKKEVGQNRNNRCYYCKRELFGQVIAKHGQERYVLDASNASDFKEYRPGLKALIELGVKSPFAECGISKQDIRNLSSLLGLSEPDQPSSPCLLTRFAYCLSPEKSKLHSIGLAEDALSELGLENFRLRVMPNQELRLQLTQKEKDFWFKNKDKIEKILSKHDLIGVEPIFTNYLSGFFDKQ